MKAKISILIAFVLYFNSFSLAYSQSMVAESDFQKVDGDVSTETLHMAMPNLDGEQTDVKAAHLELNASELGEVFEETVHANSKSLMLMVTTDHEDVYSGIIEAQKYSQELPIVGLLLGANSSSLPRQPNSATGAAAATDANLAPAPNSSNPQPNTGSSVAVTPAPAQPATGKKPGVVTRMGQGLRQMGTATGLMAKNLSEHVINSVKNDKFGAVVTTISTGTLVYTWLHITNHEPMVQYGQAFVATMFALTFGLDKKLWGQVVDKFAEKAKTKIQRIFNIEAITSDKVTTALKLVGDFTLMFGIQAAIKGLLLAEGHESIFSGKSIIEAKDWARSMLEIGVLTAATTAISFGWNQFIKEVEERSQLSKVSGILKSFSERMQINSVLIRGIIKTVGKAFSPQSLARRWMELLREARVPLAGASAMGIFKISGGVATLADFVALGGAITIGVTGYMAYLYAKSPAMWQNSALARALNVTTAYREKLLNLISKLSRGGSSGAISCQKAFGI